MGTLRFAHPAPLRQKDLRATKPTKSTMATEAWKVPEE